MSNETVEPFTPDPNTDPDTADEAAGYRSIVDDGEVDDLAPDDPNLAVAHGDDNHLDHVGDPVDDDSGVGDIVRQLDEGGGA